MKRVPQKIVKLLKKKKLNISFAESCTGGMLSSAITSISGSSKVFNLGLVVYSNKSKIKVLKVSKKIIRKYGAVSEQVCKVMVKNVSKIGKTDMSVSVTGIAGPGGDTIKKPVGLVYIGVKKDSKIKIKRYLFKKRNRAQIQRATVNKSLELILSFLK
jgi:PncC family amidohydrolase